ncbi:hypothetical protein PG988_007552 [Apiospora saccharicola]
MHHYSKQNMPITLGSPGGGPSKPKQHTAEGKKPTSWWWWWEILATILSIACMGALIVILTKIDNIPLPHWWLPIQPNSLIAVLTTVAKSSMLVSVASCISQLKWGHFSLHPRKLVDLETFDDASRGPWGSATLIWSLSFRIPVIVTSGLALTTIVSLGIDPCAQQVLTFPTQTAPLDNVTVEIGVADQYFSKGLRERDVGKLVHLQASIITSAADTVFQPHMLCPAPATRCFWESFTTLGICADYRNMTGPAEANCTDGWKSSSINCTYSFPDIHDREKRVNTPKIKWDTESYADEETTLFRSSLEYGSLPTTNQPLGTFTAIKALGDGRPTLIANNPTRRLDPPRAEIAYAGLWFCEQRYYNVTATPAGISYADINMTSEQLTVGDYVNRGDAENKMGPTYYGYIANSTGRVYNISRMSSALPNTLSTFLTSTIQHVFARPEPDDENPNLNLGYVLMNSPMDKVWFNIAASLSNQIRSADPGDNYNATTVEGKASYEETYIRVRWPWMILPLVEITLAALLLVASIIITGSVPLWKTSGLAFLVSGGWEEDGFGAFIKAREGREKMNKETLEEWGKEVKAQLIGGGEGEEANRDRLRFERVSD